MLAVFLVALLRPTPGHAEDYGGAYIFTGGLAYASIPGEGPFVRRITASLFQAEGGDVSGSGAGLSFEVRAVDFASLPHRDPLRFRVGIMGLGGRYRLLGFYRETTGRRTILHQVGTPGISPTRYSRGPAEPMHLEWASLGFFARLNALSVTTGDGQVYDPWTEGGLFTRLALPFEYTMGLEASLGAGTSVDSGHMVFLRVEALLFGHHERGGFGMLPGDRLY